MRYFDTFDSNGVFLSSEDEFDVHYKGLWHKVIRVWLYDNEGNIIFRIRKADKKLDFIDEVHLESTESITSCFDRAMFGKLGIHFPASSKIVQASLKKIKEHKVYSDNSELKDNYFLCDCIGEFNNTTNFFIFDTDTEGIVKVNAKGVYNILKTRTGEIIAHKVTPGNKNDEENMFLKVKDFYVGENEDTFQKYSYVINAINTEFDLSKKLKKEEEMIQKMMEKKQKEEEEERFNSHADENEGADVY